MKYLVLLAAVLLAAGCTDNRGRPYTSSQAAAPQPSADVQASQERLRAMGFYGGNVDGYWGPETQAAVERFQRSRGLPVTAQLDDPTLNAIRIAPTAQVVFPPVPQ